MKLLLAKISIELSIDFHDPGTLSPAPYND